MRPTFRPVKASRELSFPKQEEEILQFWRDTDAFKKQLEKTKDLPRFTQYDGPPFATGLPHYGHLLCGTTKDVVTRYASMTGHHVERRFGWDCHGLPVEHLIEKELRKRPEGFNGRDDVMKMGIAKYNEMCRGVVMQCAADWEYIVERSGRWVDFKNDYKTLDMSFMESVWWVFDQMNKKGLVYRGEKVLPYSTALNTPLSNFEAKENYKTTTSPSVVVTLPLVDEPGVSLVVWTTTPWTLPSNLACTVNPKFVYVKVRDNATGAVYVVGKGEVFYKTVWGKKAKEGVQFTVLEELSGDALLGKEYVPPFDYFAERREDGCFRVVPGDWVTAESGTGLVHCSPGFGEDDYISAKAAGLVTKDKPVLCPVDHKGCFLDSVKDFAGMYVKDADKHVKKYLKDAGRLLREIPYTHEYPYCWRSDTPLIYRTVPSWFIDVPKIRDELVAANNKTRWVPDFVKSKRFHNWLVNAREWSVSRNRYWGTPMPVWVNENDPDYWMTVGSVEQLEKLTGVKLTDLHREHVDDLVFDDPRGPEYGKMRRVEEVFDCWFESGSMPYGQAHYPFAWKGREEEFLKQFPANFVAEGLDQTRGWFYTLMVVATALFGEPAFQNVIVTGLVLAENGKKMSKSKKNYPDPELILNKYGADAVRLYLMGSPAVRAEPLRFKEGEVYEVVKDVFLTWYNVYRFFVENATRFEQETGRALEFDPEVAGKTDNEMNRWLLSRLNTVVGEVRQNFDEYKLYKVLPNVLAFLDELTHWFVPLNREQLRSQRGEEEAELSLKTMYFVLQQFCVLMAPLTPFLTEAMYQNLRLGMKDPEESVHLLQMPEVDEKAVDLDLERRVSRMMEVVKHGRTAREKAGVSFKQPLRTLLVVHPDPAYFKDVVSLKEHVQSIVNVKEVEFSSEVSAYVRMSGCPNNRHLGKDFKKDAKHLRKAVAELTHDQMAELQDSGTLSVVADDRSFTLTRDHVDMQYHFCGDTSKYVAVGPDNGLLVALDTQLDGRLVSECYARQFVSRVQVLRKSAHLEASDKVAVFYDVPEHSELSKVVREHLPYIETAVRSELMAGLPPAGASAVASARMDGKNQVANTSFTLSLTRFADPLHALD